MEEAIEELLNQAVLTLAWIDDLRAWGDEGVMRRRADMLRAAIAGYRAALAAKPEGGEERKYTEEELYEGSRGCTEMGT